MVQQVKYLLWLFLFFGSLWAFEESDSTMSQVRNPFASPEKQGGKSSGPTNVVFGVNNQNLNNVRWDYIPRIQVTGVMSVRGKNVACATVEGMGNMILRTGDRIVLPSDATGGKARSPWFLVKQIGNNQMSIQLDDGSVISGRLF